MNYLFITIGNITISISAKPVSIFTQIEPYYPPNESTEFGCKVISNPSPTITWSFLRCPNYPSLENSTIVYLTVNAIFCISLSSSNKSLFVFVLYVTRKFYTFFRT